MFLGRQPRSVTRYHYDDDGRLSWSETVGEPEWLDDDLDAALEWQIDEDGKCTGCGHPTSETFDDDMRAAWITERVTCNACASRDRAARNAGGNPPGARYRTRNRVHDD